MNGAPSIGGVPTQVVVLAGGLGTRLRPLTTTVPKPMVPVAGRPFLEYLLDLVARDGFTRVLLLTGYLGEEIERHFGDGRSRGLALSYSCEPAPMGTAGALKHAEPLIDPAFLLLNGDTFLDIDYAAFARHFASAEGARAQMALFDTRVEDVAPANASLRATGRIGSYKKNGDPDLVYVDAGVYALRREVIEPLPAGATASLEHDVFPALAAAGELAGYPVQRRYYDIGTFDRLARAEQGFA